jgi:hypothetical protein
VGHESAGVLLGDRALTTSQLAAELDDVPSGSLYRHVTILTRAGVLHVVAQHQIRGTVERTYALRGWPRHISSQAKWPR